MSNVEKKSQLQREKNYLLQTEWRLKFLICKVAPAKLWNDFAMG